jgi:hypothetical protein
MFSDITARQRQVTPWLKFLNLLMDVKMKNYKLMVKIASLFANSKTRFHQHQKLKENGIK